jgi:hypothetical protein
MNLLYICGPQAVGKMAIGKKIAEITGYKLLTNHAISEVLGPILGWGTPVFKELEVEFYWSICEQLAQSDIPGVILTKMRIFNGEKDKKFVSDTFEIFQKRNIPIYEVELYAEFEERLHRNKTPLRLEEKPSKRSIQRSDKRLREWFESNSQINSDLPFGLNNETYLKLDTTKLSVEESSDMIIKIFNLIN